MQRYIFHINNLIPPDFQQDKLLKSYVSDALAPPFIFVGNTELKRHLRTMAKEFPQVTGQ